MLARLGGVGVTNSPKLKLINGIIHTIFQNRLQKRCIWSLYVATHTPVLRLIQPNVTYWWDERGEWGSVTLVILEALDMCHIFPSLVRVVGVILDNISLPTYGNLAKRFYGFIRLNCIFVACMVFLKDNVKLCVGGRS